MFEKVRRIAADVFDVPADSIERSSTYETIASWDSVQNLNLILALEDEFGIEIDPTDFDQMVSIGGIADVVAQRIGSRGDAPR